MGVFEQFPYANMHEMNLEWLLKKMKELDKAMETFKATESLKFADPIIWDITTQYEKSTIVLDPTGNAYLSLQAVPSGIQLNNGEYWLEIFNFTEYTRTANQNLTVNTETNTTRATATYQVDDWLIWNDVLYRVTSAIAIDDALIVAPAAGSNIVHFTVEDFLKAFITYATGLINQYKNDIDASELAYRQQLAQDIATTTASLQAQFNAAIAGATVDSEVINARVGADGITYSTLGDAIRSQIATLTNELIGNITDGNFNGNLSWVNRMDGYIANPSGITADANYTTLVFTADASLEIYWNGVGSAYRSIALYNGTPSSSTFIARYRVSDGNMPTSSNRLKVAMGITIAITVNRITSSTDNSQAIYSNYYKLAKRTLENNILLNALQKAAVAASIPEIPEIHNARTGADDITYTSLGDAIRTQFTDLETELIGSINDGNFNGDLPWITRMDGYSADSSGLSPNASYTTLVFTAETALKIYWNSIGSAYRSIALYNGSPDSSTFIARYRVSDGNMPTPDNQLSVAKDTTIAITVALITESTDNSQAIYSNYYKLAKRVLDNNIELSESQKESLTKIYIQYANEAGVDASTEQIRLWLPAKNGYYYKILFLHSVMAERYADVWRTGYIRLISGTPYNETDIAPISTIGEWEGVIHLPNESDYIGGFAHGDEVTQSISVLLDGNLKNPSDLQNITAANEICIITASKMYSADDHTTFIADHYTERVYKNSQFTFNQRIKWNYTGLLNASQLSMLPIAKPFAPYFYYDRDFEITTNSGTTTGLLPDISEIVNFGNTSNPLSFAFKMVNSDVAYKFLKTDNGGQPYYKSYFTASGNNDVSVAAGDLWKFESQYILSR